VLRGMQSVGPANFYNWSGFYVGGQIGYGDANGDFSSATSPLISYALRDTALESSFAPSGWPMLGTADNHRTLYGGFAGYNTQWQDLILGIEGNYAQSQYGLIAPSTPISRLTPADSNGNTWLVNMTSSGTVTNLNYGTLRGRAGVVLGNFLPYGFAGLAIGEAAMNISVYGAGEENPPTSGACSSSATPPCSLFAFSKTTAETAVLYGFAVGGGMDVAITRNIFVRAEFEYVRFAPIMNTVLAVESARVGAGLKF
jgi:opacity protein-like surface antigen